MSWRRRVGPACPLLLLAALTFACSGAGETGAPAPGSAATRPPTPTQTAEQPPTTVALTLDDAVGAVMMVGFEGELSPAVVEQWTRRQYAGLLIINRNRNGSTRAQISRLIAQLRSVSRRRLLAATDQEGGAICIALADVHCAGGPAGRDESARMAAALRALGFDVDLGPVADVCSIGRSIMAGRCYGQVPAQVAGSVAEAVEGIHAGHLLAAAKHFPGHGSTPVSSEEQLPTIAGSLATLRERDWPPFRAAIDHGTDLILVGHLTVPAIDESHPASLSARTIALLRGELGFRGAVISDDLEMGAITATTATPEAAVQFLAAGGDMVMVAHHLAVADATFEAIRAAVVSGRLPRSRLDEAVARLAALPRP